MLHTRVYIMYTKLFMNIVLCAVLLSTLNLSKCNEDSRFDNVQHPALASMVKMRCTRRFSPGVCVDDVAPVWTFAFLAQNCTERLGCPNNYRTNRFRSYRLCMKRCRMLVDMYLSMVEYGEANSTSNRNDTVVGDGGNNDTETASDDKNLRVGLTKYYVSRTGEKKEIILNLEDLAQDLEEEEYKEEEETHAIVYKDMNVNEDILPADVDYVGGEIRSELDVLHL